MFTIYVPASEKFVTTTFIGTIPIPGDALPVNVLILNREPHWKVSEVIAAINRAPVSSNANLGKPINYIVQHSVASTGSVIVTPKGVFANPRALRNIVATFFSDTNVSADCALIDDVRKKTHWVNNQCPATRTLKNGFVYNGVITYGSKVDDRYSEMPSIRELQEVRNYKGPFYRNRKWVVDIEPMAIKAEEGTEHACHGDVDKAQHIHEAFPEKAVEQKASEQLKQTVEEYFAEQREKEAKPYEQLNALFGGVDVLGIVKALREAGVKITLDIQL